jgi:GMP synthase (glutamine-hydrolysing)
VGDSVAFEAKKFVDEQTAELKRSLKGKGKAVSALSGGVDSSTATVLAHRAVGASLIPVFIDDGLMREGEAKKVVREFKALGVRVRVLKASKRFFRALKGKPDPEEKRKAFRNVFYRVLGEFVGKNKARFLVQGTIAADILETKRGVKTQHNVLKQIGVNPKKYGFEVVEPLKTLFKPQVRRAAKALGFSRAFFERMPFPGPALATRVVGEVTPAKIKVVRKATKIVEEEVARAKPKLKPFQAFAVLLSEKATGLKKGRRAFGEIVVVRSVDSSDALTASPTRMPFSVLQKIQARITREIPSVIKVVYDVTPKPPSTIEFV